MEQYKFRDYILFFFFFFDFNKLQRSFVSSFSKLAHMLTVSLTQY